MLTQLKEAADASNKPFDPALPLKLALAKAEASSCFLIDRDNEAWDDLGATRDLVMAGLKALGRLLLS